MDEISGMEFAAYYLACFLLWLRLVAGIGLELRGQAGQQRDKQESRLSYPCPLLLLLLSMFLQKVHKLQQGVEGKGRVGWLDCLNL